MSSDLQPRGFDQSAYERPDRDWICGWTGRPCSLGPSRKGGCDTTHECRPHRDEEQSRWICARSSTFGGECEDGPLPDGECCRAVPKCQPQLSTRAKRRRFVRWSVTATIAIVTIAMGGSWGRDYITPGPLSSVHLTLANDESMCVDCHAAGSGGAAHWLGAAFSETQTEESERCLRCHNLGNTSMLPHGVALEELASKTEKFKQAGVSSGFSLLELASHLPLVPSGPGGELACSGCHMEHQGADNDLQKMSDERCQVCHEVKFDSFSDGHPAFEDYPYDRRVRIKFDHLTHKRFHYPEEDKAEFLCIGCHEPDLSVSSMLVMPFEQTCESCHRADVTGEKLTKKGVAFLNLPKLDVELLSREEGIPLGTWAPARKSAKSPFLELLALADPRLAKGDRRRVASLDLTDLADATPEDLDAVVRYAWSIKALFYDLSQTGHRALTSRLRILADHEFEERDPQTFKERLKLLKGVDKASDEAQLEREVSDQLLSELTGHLTRDTIVASMAQWVPELEAEAKIFKSLGKFEDFAALSAEQVEELRQFGVTKPERVKGPNDKSRAKWVERGGWFAQKDQSIHYRSRVHADPFVRSWIDFTGRFPVENPGPAASAAGRVFSLLQKKQVTGKCARCHSSDPAVARYAGEGLARQINWEPFQPMPARHPATFFRHEPHFSLGKTEGCEGCHELKTVESKLKEARAQFDTTYENLQLHDFAGGNFVPLTTNVCSSCHNAEATGEDCTICHNYHRGSFRPGYLTAGTTATEPTTPASEAKSN